MDSPGDKEQGLSAIAKGDSDQTVDTESRKITSDLGKQTIFLKENVLPNTVINNHSPLVSREITGFKWFLACLAMYSANFLYGLDTTITADIQAPVAKTYNDFSKLGWLGIGFTLGSVAFILPLGKAYAVFDTKWLFIGCLTMFAAGSALCGGAPSMNAIIIGRIWAGAGGAGMYLG